MKINLRNPTNEAFDFHELIKLYLASLLQRKNKKLRVETEKPIGNRIADVYMRDKKGVAHVWEIQKKITPQWKKKLEKDYTELNIIPFTVSLEEVKEKWEDRLMLNLIQNKTFNPEEELRAILSDYTI